MIKYILGIVAVVALMALWLHWAGVQDAHREIETARYETCVALVYNTTPASYRIEHGEYPTCNPDRLECNIAQGEDPTACQTRYGDKAEVLENEQTGDYWAEIH